MTALSRKLGSFTRE